MNTNMNTNSNMNNNSGRKKRGYTFNDKGTISKNDVKKMNAILKEMQVARGIELSDELYEKLFQLILKCRTPSGINLSCHDSEIVVSSWDFVRNLVMSENEKSKDLCSKNQEHSGNIKSIPVDHFVHEIFHWRPLNSTKKCLEKRDLEAK